MLGRISARRGPVLQTAATSERSLLAWAPPPWQRRPRAAPLSCDWPWRWSEWATRVHFGTWIEFSASNEVSCSWGDWTGLELTGLNWPDWDGTTEDGWIWAAKLSTYNIDSAMDNCDMHADAGSQGIALFAILCWKVEGDDILCRPQCSRFYMRHSIWSSWAMQLTPFWVHYVQDCKGLAMIVFEIYIRSATFRDGRPLAQYGQCVRSWGWFCKLSANKFGTVVTSVSQWVLEVFWVHWSNGSVGYMANKYICFFIGRMARRNSYSK